MITYLHLKTLTVIQGNPASAALEFPPACSGTRTGFYLGNREYTFSRILASLGVIRAGAFTEIRLVAVTCTKKEPVELPEL